MTKRVLSTRAYITHPYATQVPGYLAIPLLPLDEDLVLVDLPTTFDANKVSARSFSGSAESSNSNTFSFAQGRVVVQDVPSAREVAVYRRDTKELLVSGMSGPNGFFHLKWRGYTGLITVVVFDDPASGYNAKVLDLVSA